MQSDALTNHRKTRWTFRLGLWAVVAVIVLYLTCWPLAENAWAFYNWERVPCAIRPRGGFVYMYQGKRYYSIRKNFWDHTRVLADNIQEESDLPVLDRICYVRPNAPEWSVLNLDAQDHLDQGIKGLVTSLFVIAVAIAMSIVARKRGPS